MLEDALLTAEEDIDRIREGPVDEPTTADEKGQGELHQ